MNRVICTAIAATLILAAGPASANPADVDPGDIAAVADKLQLTDKQRKQIRSVHDAARKATIKLRAEIEASGIDLRRELESDSPNEANVRKLITRISQLEGKARAARVTGWLRIRKLLSAKQRAMLALVNQGKSSWNRHMRHNMRSHLRKEMARLARERRLMEREARKMRKRARDMERAERKRMRKLRHKMRKLRHKFKHKGLKDPFSSGVHNHGHHRGAVMINSTPFSKIYIDGKFVGTTPVKTTLSPGAHVIRSKSAKAERTRRVVVDADKMTVLNFQH